MRRKRSLASVLFELAAVLLMTALAFAWGKQTILDWIADLRELKKGRY